jgi:hypothetical protein
MRQMALLAASLLLALSAAATAGAEDSMQMAVVSYGKIPAGAGFQTELVENTELATRVETRLKKALTDRGLNPSADAGLVISIAADRTGGPTNLSLGNESQQNSASANAQVNINIDTSQSKLLGGSSEPATKIGRAYRITLAIYDRTTGRYVWRAEITDNKPDVDPAAATGPMVEKLASALEKSVGPAN